MKIKKCAVLVLVASIALSIQGSEDKDLLFYCNYNGSVDAAYARGDKTGKCAIPPEFQEGVNGQALLVGGRITGKQKIVNGIPVVKEKGRNCYYSPDKNFDIQKGTLSFWLKPLDWNASTKGFNMFFQTSADKNFFQIYKYFCDERLLFLRGAQGTWTGVKYEIASWQPGQWHHVAVTWGPTEIKMYINGQMVCRRQVKFPLADFGRVKPLSVGPGNAWKKAFNGQSLIDELRIHGRQLTSEEIIALYSQYAPKVNRNEGLVTIGKKTPEIDGAINDFEYSFAGTGFSNVSNGQMSKRQSHYFLSYDKDKFYFGYQSALDKEKTGDNVELFLGVDNDKSVRLVFTPSGSVEINGKPCGNNGAALKSSVDKGIWTLEAGLPFEILGVSSAPDNKDWKINIVRTYSSPAQKTSVPAFLNAPSDNNWMTLSFRPEAPEIRIADICDLVNYVSRIDISAKSDNPQTNILSVITIDNTCSYGLKTLTRRLFANGASTPFRAPRKPSKEWKLQDFALMNIKIVEEKNGKRIPLFSEKFIYEEQAPMKTMYLYTRNRKQLFVSALRRADGKIRVRFLRPDNTLAWSASKDIPKGAGYFNALFDLDFTKLTPDTYTVKIDHIAPDGKATETWEQAYKLPSVDSPILRKYVDPEEGVVPAPWTPLKTIGNVVKTWGRSYDFSGGFLFSSLKSQGHELLASPAVLSLDGNPLSPTEAPVPVLISSNDMLAVIEKNADLGKLSVSSRIKTHFDGYCAIEMTLDPGKKAKQIKTLSLDIPLRGEFGELVRDNKLSPLLGGKSGAVGNYWSQSLGNNPFLWVGDEHAGFNWLAPGLEKWHFKKKDKNVEIIRKGDIALLRFNLVDYPLLLDAPKTFKFGFALTPTRPLNKKLLRKRLGKEWEMWCQPWKYFAVPDYETANRGWIKRRSKNVDEIFLYLGVSLTSPFSPEWAFWEEEWRGKKDNIEYGRWTGNPSTLEARNRCCYTDGDISVDTFRNYIQHTRAKFFEKAKTPLTPKAINYYFDTGAGRTRDIDATRELALNVYRMIKRTGPNAKIMSHQGWVRLMPSQHFTDVIIGGEGVENILASSGSYYNLLTPEMFRATFLPQIWGVKTALINMLVRAAGRSPEKLSRFSKDPEAQRAMRHVYGYCLVHDVELHDPHKETLAIRKKVWDAQDKLGWNENVKFHPYWEPDSGVALVSPKSNRILASAYSNNGNLMLAVLNDTDKVQDIKLSLDTKKLGVKEGLTGKDVFDPEKTYVLSGAWHDTLPPLGFRLILWAPNKNSGEK